MTLGDILPVLFRFGVQGIESLVWCRNDVDNLELLSLYSGLLNARY